MVCPQLVAFFNKNALLPRHQSAYRRRHSTETAVLKIVSDLFLARDRCRVSLLALLDLSTAFDTVDHTILLDRLQSAFGVRGSVFDWIESFITSPEVSRPCQTSYAASHKAVY